MPLPIPAALNSNFDFPLSVGFATRGPCSRETIFATRDGTQIFARPGDRPYFAVINNQFLRGSDGIRRPEPISTSQFGYPIGSQFNHATVGAWLECPGVVITSGEELRFFWNFLPFEDLPQFNDFALLVAIDQADQVVFKGLIADVRTFLGAQQSGWKATRWAPSAGFTGRLLWVSSNGFVAAPSAPPTTPSPAANSSPLLLDRIEIGPPDGVVEVADVVSV